MEAQVLIARRDRMAYVTPLVSISFRLYGTELHVRRWLPETASISRDGVAHAGVSRSTSGSPANCSASVITLLQKVYPESCFARKLDTHTNPKQKLAQPGSTAPRTRTG